MANQRARIWHWVLPLLLLTMWLGARSLDVDGLWYDEVWSVYNAGGAQYGPLAPTEIWQRLATEDPDQGFAYPLLLSGWGALVGWSEFATRALSLLVGVLCVATVFRLGRDTMHPIAGLGAAGVLSVSAFFIYYTHELRVFTMVVLASGLTLWCYWRIVTHHRRYPNESLPLPPQIGFILGGLGLLYTHYFAATLLIALGIYHALLGVGNWRQGRDGIYWRYWWRIGWLTLIVGLLFSPWLPILYQSLTRTATRTDVHENALNAVQIIITTGSYLLNGWSNIFAGLLGISILGLKNGKRLKHDKAMLVSIAGLLSLVVIVMNGVLQIIEPGRARYLLILWLPLALWAGLGLYSLFGNLVIAPQKRKNSGFTANDTLLRLAGIFVGIVWLYNGILATMNPAYTAQWTEFQMPRWHVMTDIMQEQGTSRDLFAFYAGNNHAEYDYSFQHVTHAIPFTKFITHSLAVPDTTMWGQGKIMDALRVWYGVDQRELAHPLPEYDILNEILAKEFIFCATFYNDAYLRFDLYARAREFCSPSGTIAQFGGEISLLAHSTIPEIATGSQWWDMQWHTASTVPADTYNVAIHIIPQGTQQPAKQFDFALPLGEVGLSRQMLVFDDLPPATYDIYVIVYRWQTGERVVGRHLTTGEQGDRLKLGSFMVP